MDGRIKVKQERGRHRSRQKTDARPPPKSAEPVVSSLADTTAVPRVTHWTVEAGDDGQRVDNYLLRRAPGVPKSHIYRVIRSGEVRVNGGRVKAATRVRTDDRVRVPPLRLAPRGETRAPDALARDLRTRVVYEHDDFVAIAKPDGLPVHAGSGAPFGLIEALRQALDAPRLELVHRLDRATSGVLLVARDNGRNRALQELFRHRSIDKRYLALVDGRWPDDHERITAPLTTNVVEAGERRTQVSRDGKAAATRFRILECFDTATLLEATLETGRTHQIRAHTRYVGCAIVGDRRYGDKDINAFYRRRGLARLFLHAARLGFEWNGDRIELDVAPDADWYAAIDGLRALGNDRIGYGGRAVKPRARLGHGRIDERADRRRDET